MPTEWSQLVAMMPYSEILAPGSRYSYSNPAFIFLARIVEKVSGDDYEAYVEKNILRPLEMSHAYFDRTPYHLLRFRSNNYTLEKDGIPKADGLDFDTGITASNSGLNAPLTDMAKYMRFLLGSPGLSADAKAVLTRASLQEMWTPSLAVSARDGRTTAMAFALFVGHGAVSRVIGHTNGQKAFNSLFTYTRRLGRPSSLPSTRPCRRGKKPVAPLVRQGDLGAMDSVIPSLAAQK